MNSHRDSREQLIREASLTKEDLAEVTRCRGDYNRLGIAYQIGFVRLHNRFPTQQPLEIHQDLASQKLAILDYARRKGLFIDDPDDLPQAASQAG